MSLLTLLRRRGGIAYLLLARFSQDIAAPLPSSLPVDVGGPLTVVQNDGQLSQSGGKLVFPTQITSTFGDLGFYDATGKTRVAGRALLAKSLHSTFTSAGNFPIAFAKTASISFAGFGQVAHAFYVQSGTLSPANANTNGPAVATLTTGVEYEFALVLRASGAFWLIRGGAFTAWTLLWVSNVESGATVYPGFSNSTGIGTLDDFRVLDLSQFATDAQVYTNRLVSPAAGATTTSTADAWIEFTTTYASSNTDVHFRISDALNFWRVRVASDGALRLSESTAGSVTVRGSSSGVFTGTNVYRVVTTAEGTTIKVYVNNTLHITYSSATLNQASTQVEADVVGSPVSELICWPRTPAFPGGI